MGDPFTELAGELAVPLPGQPIAGIIAYHNAGGPITIIVRWYPSEEAAKVDLKRVVDNAIQQGARGTIEESLT